MTEIDALADPETFRPFKDARESEDPLGFPDYRSMIERARAQSGSNEAVVTGGATIGGRDVVLALFEFNFLAGSMGEVAGERLAEAMEAAAEREIPFVLRTATGGARMQEGMRSLIQMPKTVAARLALERAAQPFVAVLGHPTTGGVLASLGSLADVTIAEDDATIGFAGPRLVELVTGAPPGEDSHNARAAVESGLVDEVAAADAVRDRVAHCLDLLRPDSPEEPTSGEKPEVRTQVGATPWPAVRDPNRASATGIARELGDHFELRGDREGRDDPAVVTMLARVMGRRCILVALDREHNPGPAAYRKTRRAIAVGSRLSLPVVTLVDTPGADPSPGSERGGVAWEIAALFQTILTAPVPVLSIVTGEGGSGGALAFAAGDLLLIYSDAMFSVIAPDLAAEILWRDPARDAEAASALRVSAADLRDLGIADGVLQGPADPESVRSATAYHLDRLSNERLDGTARAFRRQAKWRNLGKGR
ncbi:MAG: acetyl-CoA carboxylase carboxyl transferase subunit beta [Actinomycetota bacterium]|nr:acetyl-CoA carboxylase carboxyl transferase subunit beta [Actinomycetota bacterium]